MGCQDIEQYHLDGNATFEPQSWEHHHSHCTASCRDNIAVLHDENAVDIAKCLPWVEVVHGGAREVDWIDGIE